MDFKKILDKVLKGLKWFFFSYIWLFIVLFVTDLVTKICMVNYFRNHSEPIVLIKGFLRINYTINDAAAFGFGLENLTANRVIYCIAAVIGLILIVGIYVWKFKKLNGLVRACLMMMTVGAFGNLIDRIFYTPEFLHWTNNGVVDWIDFYGIWQFIFNIADAAIVVGTLMLIVYLIVDEVKEVRKNRNKEVKESGGRVLSKEEMSRLEKENEELEAPAPEVSGETDEID